MSDSFAEMSRLIETIVAEYQKARLRIECLERAAVELMDAEDAYMEATHSKPRCDLVAEMMTAERLRSAMRKLEAITKAKVALPDIKILSAPEKDAS